MAYRFKPQKISDADTLFQKRLKTQMNFNHETQIDLCNALGISHSTVNKWLRRGHIPHVDTIQKIAKHYGIQTGYLLGETNNPLKRWS